MPTESVSATLIALEVVVAAVPTVWSTEPSVTETAVPPPAASAL